MTIVSALGFTYYHARVLNDDGPCRVIDREEASGPVVRAHVQHVVQNRVTSACRRGHRDSRRGVDGRPGPGRRVDVTGIVVVGIKGIETILRRPVRHSVDGLADCSDGRSHSSRGGKSRQFRGAKVAFGDPELISRGVPCQVAVGSGQGCDAGVGSRGEVDGSEVRCCPVET